MTQSSGPAREAEALARRLRALAHPARLRILATLADSNTCHCGDIVRGLPLAQSTVSEHLRILREAGFVRGETAAGRPCYCLDQPAIEKLAADFERLAGSIARRRDPAARRGARKGADRTGDRNAERI